MQNELILILEEFSKILVETLLLKVAFFQKGRFIFQISKKKRFQKTILSWKFKIPAHNSIML